MLCMTSRLVCIIAKMALCFAQLLNIILTIATILLRFVIMIIKAFIRNKELETTDLNTSEVTSTALMEETLYPKATVGLGPTDSTQCIIPPAELTQPLTDSIKVTSTALMEETLYPKATVGLGPTDSTQCIIPPAELIQPLTDSIKVTSTALMEETLYPKATVGLGPTDSTQCIIPPAELIQPLTDSIKVTSTALMEETLYPKATVGLGPTDSTQCIIPPAELTQPLTDSIKVTSTALMEETLYPKATVGLGPTDSTQCIIPPAELTQPLTDSIKVTSTALMEETLYPKATVGLGPTDSTQCIIPPAANTSSIRTDRPIVNVSSSKNTDKIETVGSVKRCKEHINVIFNKMHERNLQTKCKELEQIIVEVHDKCLPWLARYMVNRISVEPNYHTMYSSFLNLLNNEKLTELITMETEKNIKALLSRNMVSPMCRQTLKYLGSWYGSMTLAKNKPIDTTFNLKRLLIKAYQGGEQKMMYTLPLVTRILESCANSTVFNTTSSWTMDLIYCLSELHRQPGLKLKFQCEIEILCKKLEIELKYLKPTTRYFTKNA